MSFSCTLSREPRREQRAEEITQTEEQEQAEQGEEITQTEEQEEPEHCIFEYVIREHNTVTDEWSDEEFTVQYTIADAMKIVEWLKNSPINTIWTDQIEILEYYKGRYSKTVFSFMKVGGYWI